MTGMVVHTTGRNRPIADSQDNVEVTGALPQRAQVDRHVGSHLPSTLPWHRLYLLPLPQAHSSLARSPELSICFVIL